MTNMDLLAFLLVGALLGAAGQGARLVVGLKKEIAAAKASGKRNWFDRHEFVVSFVLGAVAGVAAAVSQYEANVEITQSLLLGFAAAGYSGSDFFGGLLKGAP
jgi:cell division protein FtsX